METKIYYRIKKRRNIWKNFPKRLIQHRNFKWVALAVILGLGPVFRGETIGSASVSFDNTSHNVIPEPSTISLFCAGAAFLFFSRAGRKTK